MRTPSDEDRCSLRSLAAEESLVGTASTIRHWLLVESDGPWGRDGLRDARLPEGLGDELRALERRTDARVLLIRRTDRRPSRDDGRITSVAVDTRGGPDRLATARRIEDAVALDPRDVDAFEPSADPLFVVCTHGRRDPCCAEQGRPLAERLAATARDDVWESTHIGGDRFAANLVAFPHGLYFGRLEPRRAGARRRLHGGPDLAAPSLPRAGLLPAPRPDRRARPARRPRIDRLDELSPRRARRAGDEAEVVFATPRGEVRVTLERSPGTRLRLTCHADREETPWVWRTRAIELADT